MDESIVEPERLEDALTSTVFGTLLWVGAGEILARWLRVPSGLLAAGPTTPIRECWFWPRMAFAEPDVVLRLGDVLVVVEAKYRSGRHDVVAPSDVLDHPYDQLLRQNQCVTTPPDSRARYAEPIELAICQCQLVQAFVVDARRQVRARREYEESKALLPNACLQLVTWQTLFRMLGEGGLPARRWAADLRAYLERVGLDTFEGLGRRLGDRDDLRRVSQWRARRAATGFQDALLGLTNGAPVAGLHFWRPSKRRSAKRHALLGLDQRVIDGAASRAILAWRGLSGGPQSGKIVTLRRRERGKTR
jgi:hypothetical protein